MFWSSPKATMPQALLAVHPYYPLGVEIANFVANDTDFITLLVQFGIGWLIILSLTWVLTSTFCPRVKKLDKWIILWWVLTGSIHLFFEGYFALNHERMASSNSFFGQLWKEYAYSDSRYANCGCNVCPLANTCAQIPLVRAVRPLHGNHHRGTFVLLSKAILLTHR